MTNLDVAFNYLVDTDEGSKYTNDPDDSGGPTKFGITKATYEEFFKVAVSDDVIAEMTPETAKQIYSALYWARLRCGDIQDLGLATAIFDSSVLYGVGTIALLVQRALSLCGATLELDGILGDKSIELINRLGGGALSNRTTILTAFHGLLLEHIDAVIVAKPKDEKYRHGWTLRADRLLRLLDEGYLAQLQNQTKETV